MYEKLIKSLREATGWENASVHYSLMKQAADTIEELSKKVDEWQEEACKWNNEYYYLLDNMPHWIPVTEELPSAYEEVLLHFSYNQAAGFIDRDGYWSVYSGDGFYTEIADNESKPTHWAKKLPEPPKRPLKKW